MEGIRKRELLPPNQPLGQVTDMDFSDRKLFFVSIDEIAMSKDNYIGGKVEITLNSARSEGMGPGATLAIGMPFDCSRPLREAEHALIDAAIGLLQKLALFRREELFERLEADRA